MSWGEVYKTTNFGLLPSYIHLGFNKAFALATETFSGFIDSVQIYIDSILTRISKSS